MFLRILYVERSRAFHMGEHKGKGKATPAFGYVKDASACLQSDGATECTFNGTAKLPIKTRRCILFVR